MLGGKIVTIIRKVVKGVLIFKNSTGVQKLLIPHFSHVITKTTNIWRDCSILKTAHCRSRFTALHCHFQIMWPWANHPTSPDSGSSSVIHVPPAEWPAVPASQQTFNTNGSFVSSDYMECQITSSSKTLQFYKDKLRYQGIGNNVRFHTPWSHYNKHMM